MYLPLLLRGILAKGRTTEKLNNHPKQQTLGGKLDPRETAPAVHGQGAAIVFIVEVVVVLLLVIVPVVAIVKVLKGGNVDKLKRWRKKRRRL